MGWTSGSELLDSVWEIVEEFIPEGHERMKAAEQLLCVFEGMDCDTTFECQEVWDASGRPVDEEE
jgi:hypothetical protein